MKKILCVFALVILTSACSHQKFDLAGTRSTIPTHQGTTHFVFWGLGQVEELNPNEICGRRGVASVETGVGFWQGFASALTWGIYSPMEYSVYCNADDSVYQRPTRTNFNPR